MTKIYIKHPVSIFIEGREWRSPDGDSYFTNRVWVDGEIAFVTQMDYGYGDHFYWEGVKELVKRGYLNEALDTPQKVRESGIHFYRSLQRVGKRELFKVAA